ncbi:hypothetical protein TNCV_831801 [Trichonephila clavipes]|nr:hypothetical protein TNCV_831801 [Trichonephila clavipes]
MQEIPVSQTSFCSPMTQPSLGRKCSNHVTPYEVGGELTCNKSPCSRGAVFSKCMGWHRVRQVSVYETPVNSTEELVARIAAATADPVFLLTFNGLEPFITAQSRNFERLL